jgi:peptidoglycan-associated lipoprotein
MQRTLLSTALMVGALLLTSCHKKTVAPPQPPPPPPAAPPAPAPTITLRANPGTITSGSPTTLQWTAQNATGVRIEPGLGDVNASGNRQVSPTSSVTYTATATGPGGTASDTARVTVNAAPPPPPAPPPSAPNVSIDQLFSQNVQTVYFDYDKSEIRPDQMSRLQSNARWLKQNPTVRFTIEGHCDERGSQEYNLALGDRRANAVREFLISQGIPEANMKVISYGEERPVCREETEDCFQRNRRAEFVLNQ